MALKRKILKEEYDKLPDVLKAEYKEKNGSYLADIEGDDEAVTALKQAKDNEKNEHGKTKEALKNLQDQLDALTGEKHKKDGNIEAIEKSWQEKYTKRESELITQNSTLKDTVTKSVKESLTTSLASEISNSPSLMKRILSDRILVEIGENGPSHRVLDAQGKPSALTLDDLKKEIIANKEYAPIIIASRASGAGGTDKPNGSGGTRTYTDKEGKPLNLATMDPSSLAETIKAQKGTEN